jgi:hypothetical protein
VVDTYLRAKAPRSEDQRAIARAITTRCISLVPS